MFKTAKPAYFALLSEMPGNAYDARKWLSKRRDARRAEIPFTPLACFGLPMAENEWPPARVEPGAVAAGAAKSELET